MGCSIRTVPASTPMAVRNQPYLAGSRCCVPRRFACEQFRSMSMNSESHRRIISSVGLPFSINLRIHTTIRPPSCRCWFRMHELTHTLQYASPPGTPDGSSNDVGL